jgi:hypothetical protein
MADVVIDTTGDLEVGQRSAATCPPNL